MNKVKPTGGRARRRGVGSDKAKAPGRSAPVKRDRLRPGGLDEIVLAYLREHRAEAPLTPTAVGKGVGRSAGAVSNCLSRLSQRGGPVRKARGRPHAYSMVDKH